LSTLPVDIRPTHHRHHNPTPTLPIDIRPSLNTHTNQHHHHTIPWREPHEDNQKAAATQAARHIVCGDTHLTDGTFVVEEAAAAIRAYAEDGINIVIAHGTQYGGSLAEIAPDFPETSFIWGTATDTQGLPNVYAYSPEADQGGYVNGYLAAGISGDIGVVGPVDAGDASAYVNGFVMGAQANGASAPSVVYTGSFSDVQLATDTAQAHVDNGAAVLTGTSQSAVGAVNIATANDLPWFGTQSNTEPWSSDLTVASQVYHWDVVLAPMIEQIESGTLGGEAMLLTLENGGLVMEFNGCYDLDSGLKSDAEGVIEEIIAGNIATK